MDNKINRAYNKELNNLLEKFERLVFRGQEHPKDWESIEKEYRTARTNLRKFIKGNFNVKRHS